MRKGSALTRAPGAVITPNNVTAMLWALAAAASTAAMGAAMKVVSTELPTATIVFWRMLFSLGLLTPWLARNGVRVASTARLGEHFARAAWGTLALALLIYALAHLPLADTVALSFTRPLWMTVFAALFLGEALRLRRGIATVAGFLGVVVMIRPQGGIEPAMLAALGVALCGVFALVHVKRLVATEPAARIVFYYSVFGLLVSTPFAAYAWTMPDAAQFAWIALSALGVSTGLYCQSRACRVGDATVVAPLDYSQLPIAALIGIFAFAEIPSLWTVAGTLLIAGSTLYIARREAYLRRLREPGG